VQLASAELLERPRNTAVLRGDRAVLYCSTNGSSLHWKFTSTNASKQYFIYDERQGLKPSLSRRNVSVQRDTNGQHHLVFATAQLYDAGTYTCQDGDGDAHAAWLAVLGQFACDFYRNYSILRVKVEGRGGERGEGVKD